MHEIWAKVYQHHLPHPSLYRLIHFHASTSDDLLSQSSDCALPLPVIHHVTVSKWHSLAGPQFAHLSYRWMDQIICEVLSALTLYDSMIP